MIERVDSAARLIAASPSTVFKAFSSAGALKAWLPPDNMSAKMLSFAFSEGGGYRMRLTYDDPQHGAGKTTEEADEVDARFLRIVPDQRIEQVVRFSSDDPAFAGEMRMTWLFETAGVGTRVTVRCENVPPGIRPQDHQAGLASSLDNLAAFAEGKRTTA